MLKQTVLIEDSTIRTAEIDSQRYTGNKGSYGSYQNIINEFPVHTDFISGFAGSGSVEKRKKLAPGQNIVFELSGKVIEKFWQNNQYGYTVHFSDFLAWYASQKKELCGPHRLIFCDPPYLHSTRSSGKDHYEHEWDEQTHKTFLQMASRAKDNFCICHPKCKLYDKYLQDWRVKQWRVMTHTGPGTETLYMNYAKPRELHQYNYLGDNFTDRQRNKRRRDTLQKRLQQLTPEQRIAELHELYMLLEISKPYLGA